MMRTVATALGLSVAFATATQAFSQSAPQHPASIEDIQISEDGGRVSILVKLSEQPRGAGAWAEPGGVRLDIDGLSVPAISLSPPPGRIVSHVATSPAPDGATILHLSGVMLEDLSTTLYRNAVLVTARLAEAPDGLATAPKALPPVPTSSPVVAVAAPGGVASLAGLDQSDCAAAASALTIDTWNVQAIGERALCAIAANDIDTATPLLDQLESFAPDDWRVALGRAEIARALGDRSKAVIGYRTAASRASDPAVREAIRAYLDGDLRSD